MRVFLDANILFSAAKADGAIRRFLGMLTDNGHELWFDGFVLEEARRNLARKFPEAMEALEALLKSAHQSPQSTRGALPPEVESVLPEKDRPVLAAAIRAGCDALMTGDKTHFGALFGRTISGVTIYSPAGLATSVLNSQSRRPAR